MVVVGGNVVVVEVVEVASVVTGATVVVGAEVVEVSSLLFEHAAAMVARTNERAMTVIRDMRGEDTGLARSLRSPVKPEPRSSKSGIRGLWSVVFRLDFMCG